MPKPPVELETKAIVRASRPSIEDSIFAGDWEISSYVMNYMTAMGDSESLTWIGKRFYFGDTLFIYDTTAISNPQYNIKTITTKEFDGNYDRRPELKLRDSLIQEISVTYGRHQRKMFYQTNTVLIHSLNGVYFYLKRAMTRGYLR